VSAHAVKCKGLDNEACIDNKSRCKWSVRNRKGKCKKGKCNRYFWETACSEGTSCEWIKGRTCEQAKCDNKLEKVACVSPCAWKDGKGCKNHSRIEVNILMN